VQREAVRERSSREKPIEFVGLYPFASISDASSYGQDWSSVPEYVKAIPRLADVRGKYHFNFHKGNEEL
jgi:hypothetical protein